MSFRIAILGLLLHNAFALPTAECPILGPMFPYDFDLAESAPIKSAIDKFPSVVESLFETEQINRSYTTFSIDVFSTVTQQSIYQYHHVAPGLNGSLLGGKLDDDTIFRIGSVSKLYTSYAILAEYGSLDILDHPVTDYLPELKGNANSNPVDKIVYEDITVGALMAQQGGTGGVPYAEAVSCYYNSTCTKSGFLAAMRDHTSPVTLPFHDPLYSDAGFATLGLILERMTGLSYNDAVHKALVEPLDLQVSTSIKPNGSLNALALPGSPAVSSWGDDNQLVAAAGGIYSNHADLRRLGISIMNSELLTPAQTRQWMKPHGMTSSLTTALGAPWEIFRLNLPVTQDSSRTRLSDLYTKLGGQAGYGAVFGLSPDHGLGFSVLVAGPDSTADRLNIRATVGEAFVVAAEWAAAEKAAENLAGTFVDEKAKDTDLTLTFDSDHPGLGLESLLLEGVESRSLVIEPLGSYIGVNGVDIRIRMYPSEVENTLSSSKKESSYRAFGQVLGTFSRAEVEGGTGLFDDSCASWQEVGFWKALNGFGYDQFLFETVDGRVEKVTYPATGNVFTRV